MRRTRSILSGAGLVLLGAVASLSVPVAAWSQDTSAGPNPIRYKAMLDGAQSVAVNSTALETRTGTGTADILFDPVTGDLSYEIQFQGLIAEDITLGDPMVNPDGSTPGPGTINGNSLQGGGLFLLHFHVGAPGANGPIPVDIVAQGGPAIGVNLTDPDPIQMQASGRVVGAVNIFDLATDGILLNNVPVDGRDDGIRDPTCVRCGLIEAFLSNNVYVNIHTFNNPFGETRGQLLAATCTTQVNTIAGLRSVISALATDGSTRLALLRRLRVAERRVQAGLIPRGRAALASLGEDVIELSTRQRAVVGILDANDLNCAIANTINGLAPATSSN